LAEECIAKSASCDGDVDRVERMLVYEELWAKCNDRIRVKFISLVVVKLPGDIKVF